MLHRLVNFFRRHATPTTDPVHLANVYISGAVTEIGREVVDYCTINKTRISGALSAISSVALGYEGIRSQNPVLITAAAVSLGADAILIRYGDPIRDAGDHNPQDKHFEWKDATNFRDYPHETSTIGYTAQSTVMALADIGSGNLNASMGYLAAGATDLMGSAITFFVREKENPTQKFKNAVLNLPGIKQIANLAETRTNLTAGLVSVTGLGYLTLTDLAKNNWSVETSAPILTFTAATLGSEVFYWFAEKRGHVREELEEKGIINNEINDDEISIDEPGMAKDI